MSVTIWFLVLLALPVILYVYENKQNQAYLAELEILDEPYKRLLETGVLNPPDYNQYEYRPKSFRPSNGELPACLRYPRQCRTRSSRMPRCRHDPAA